VRVAPKIHSIRELANSEPLLGIGGLNKYIKFHKELIKKGIFFSASIRPFTAVQHVTILL
jgi:hypothetical protein